jgi:hypothetical protein
MQISRAFSPPKQWSPRFEILERLTLTFYTCWNTCFMINHCWSSASSSWFIFLSCASHLSSGMSLTCHWVHTIPGPEYVEGFLSSSFHKPPSLTQVCCLLFFSDVCFTLYWCNIILPQTSISDPVVSNRLWAQSLPKRNPLPIERHCKVWMLCPCKPTLTITGSIPSLITFSVGHIPTLTSHHVARGGVQVSIVCSHDVWLMYWWSWKNEWEKF